MTVERSCVLVGSDPQLWTMASLACRPYGALLHSDDRAGALALLGAPHVSAVITESELPDGTGFELASDVRRRAQLPVLLISMRNTHRSVHQAYAAGARYLCMPVARAQLDLFVREAFSHALWPRRERIFRPRGSTARPGRPCRFPILRLTPFRPGSCPCHCPAR